MIEKVNKIKNFGLFKDFKWNDDVKSFSNYNLIYGWNYSGKTTLSRIFRCIELTKLHSDFQNAEFVLTDDQNNKITQMDLVKSPYTFTFRVFNSDFVEDTLHWSSQEAEPIFVLGKKDIELQMQIELKKKEINDLSDEKRTNEREKSNLDKDLEDKLSYKARELDRIRPPYDKRKLKNKLEEIKLDSNNYSLAKDDIQQQLAVLKDYPKNKLSEIQTEFLNLNILKEIEDILDKTVISQTIEKLKNNPELNDWIKKGLNLHKDKNICEFCGGIITQNILEEYEMHFSEEYNDLIVKLNTLIQNLKNYQISISLPDEKRLYPPLETQYKDIKTKHEQYASEYNKNINMLIGLLTEKNNNPFKKLSEKLIRFDYALIKEYLQKMNDVIRKHNDISDNFNSEQENAFKKLELHYAYEFNVENKYFDTLIRIEELGIKINKNYEEIEKKKKEINEIESQLSDISKAADKINQYLRSMFGKEHIKIEATDKNKFKILRDDSEAKNLSSGEKTAIAFSYFLTRLEDKDTDISKAIIFIDDPVSSLDSNHLYNIFALIQAKLRNCHQLLISTHNHEFFNLIKEWFRKVEGNKKKCRFYLSERITKNGDEVSDVRALPTTLLIYKSEYHFLFSKIKSFADNPCTDYDNLYQLPNIIRRFLEAFIGFKYSAGLASKDGLQKLVDDESDRIKVERFVHEFSHQRDLNRSLRFCDTNECKTIVDIVLTAVESKDSDHYKTLEEVYHDANNQNSVDTINN